MEVGGLWRGLRRGVGDVCWGRGFGVTGREMWGWAKGWDSGWRGGGGWGRLGWDLGKWVVVGKEFLEDTTLIQTIRL